MKHNEIELEDWKDFAKSFPLYEQLRNKTNPPKGLSFGGDWSC